MTTLKIYTERDTFEQKHMSSIQELIKVVKEQQLLDARAAKLRANLRNAMSAAHITRIVVDDRVTISLVSDCNYDKFDSKKFKRDYPSLHNQYTNSCYKDEFVQVKGVK